MQFHNLFTSNLVKHSSYMSIATDHQHTQCCTYSNRFRNSFLLDHQTHQRTSIDRPSVNAPSHGHYFHANIPGKCCALSTVHMRANTQTPNDSKRTVHSCMLYACATDCDWLATDLRLLLECACLHVRQQMMMKRRKKKLVQSATVNDVWCVP